MCADANGGLSADEPSSALIGVIQFVLEIDKLKPFCGKYRLLGQIDTKTPLSIAGKSLYLRWHLRRL